MLATDKKIVFIFSDISLNETKSELEGCIHRIIAIQGKGQFWKEVQGIQSGKTIVENNFCFILRTKPVENNWREHVSHF
jgi:hypothetical protein